MLFKLKSYNIYTTTTFIIFSIGQMLNEKNLKIVSDKTEKK
jgi:hypothetical protein